ncbi:MAG: acyl-CoA dehydrogenase, partial [Saprospiraceae bacterium]|nr:acyl-CoA dehydrogenase [Saprospiraceae bacterium]
ETDHGSNVKGLETTLTYDATDKTITVNTPHMNAGKEYIGNALHSTHAVVFGQLLVNGEEHGIHAVIVRIRNDRHELMKGVRVEDNGYKMGLNGIDNGKIWFDNVSVSSEALLDRYGTIEDNQYKSPIEGDDRRFFTMLSALVAGRVSVAWAGVSAAKKALTIATRYALRRRQFEAVPGEEESLLLDYPSHQRRLLPLIARAYAYDAAMKELTAEYAGSLDKEDRREVESRAAGLKAMTSWNATRTIQECREACGGKGYLAENQFADLKADTDIFTTFEGDNVVLLQLVAKGLLSDMRKQFHDEGFITVLRYLAKNITIRLTDMNPVNTRRTDASHLLDPDLYIEAFRYREYKLLNSVAQRMRNYIGKGLHPSEAFLRCQNHLITLAKAHVDKLVLKSFYKFYTNINEGQLRDLMKQVYQIYALSTIEEHKGWYLESEYMQPSKTKAIRRMVTKLCSQLRDRAETLVSGFGIPEELVAAPIARN